MTSGSIQLAKSKKVSCPICGSDHGCLLMPHRNAVICIRQPEGCAKRRDGTPIVAKNGFGWVHRLDDKGLKIDGDKVRKIKKADKKEVSHSEWKAMLKEHQKDLNPAKVAEISKSLGLSERALKAFGMGYDRRTGAVSFPMYDGARRLCGLRLRFNGEKRSVYGSQNGLFIPTTLDLEYKSWFGDPDLLLLLPEGPTDACAANDLGFRAIGRPFNRGGGLQLLQLLRTPKHSKQDVVIIADHDPVKYLKDGTPHWPGWEGALDLAEIILPVCGRLRVVSPPEKAKDLRAWLQSKGSAAGVGLYINASPYVTRDWLAAKNAEVQLWKKRLRKPATTQMAA